MYPRGSNKEIYVAGGMEMSLKKIWALYFSPAGTTEKTVVTIAQELADRFAVPLEKIDFTRLAARTKSYVFCEDDLVVVGAPTYAGKIPNKIMPDFKKSLQGNGAVAVGVATYGNRAYEHILPEMAAILEEDGFHVVAAGAFVCQHSIGSELAKGRPEASDLEEMKEFAGRIADKVSRGDLSTVQGLPGEADGPYYIPLDEEGRHAKFLKARPKTDAEKCNRCGLCATLCPMGAIELEEPFDVSGICIKCHACVRHCPTQAKYFDDPVMLSHVRHVVGTYGARKENATFL